MQAGDESAAWLSRPRARFGIEPIELELEPEERSELGLDLETPLFLLRDRFGLAGDPLVSPLPVVVLSLLDGRRDAGEVAREIERRYGESPTTADVEALIRELEGLGLLEGPTLEAHLEEFARSEARAPACLGSYPAEPADLTEFLGHQYTRPGGPGAPPALEACPGSGSDDAGRLRALVAPHIDLIRGGHGYAWAWGRVAEECPADVFVVFGTSHTGTAPLLGAGARGLLSPRFALTRKHYQTPLGVVPTARGLLDELLAAYDGPDDLLAGEIHHRREHSIEFQAVQLAHLFGGRREVQILPVLCGGIDDVRGDPRHDPRLAAFHDALSRVLAALSPERVAFVAAIDLAHKGEQFDEPPLAAEALPALAAADRTTLRLAVEERCPDRVHHDVMKDFDARNICGHAPLVNLLLATGSLDLEGELLHYDAWHDGVSAVSFASAVWREKR